MGQKPSVDQQAIIDNKTENILVPAAAGSGKTTVMIERIITKIIEDIKDDSIPENEKHSLDSILVVTFTIAAAEHMREKAEDAINKAISDNRDDPALVAKLTRQKDLLPNSYIQTFDSFCARVIREKGYCAADSEEADVFDPANIVLDEHEKTILKNAAAKQAVKQMYESVKDESDPFIKLTQRFGDGRTDSSLITAALDIYDKLRSLPRYKDVIIAEVEKRKLCDDSGKLAYADKMTAVMGDVIDFLVRKKSEIESQGGLTDLLNTNPELYVIKKGKLKDHEVNERSLEFVGKVTELIERHEKLFRESDYDDIYDLAFMMISEWQELKDAYGFARMTTRSSVLKDDPGLYREYDLEADSVRAIFNLILEDPKDGSAVKRSAPKELADLFSLLKNNDKNKLLQLQKERTEVTGAMVGLLLKIDKCFSELKAGVHGMDFSDQEYAAYDILDTEDAAHFYQDKFVEIYIDEYQDNTRLQDDIISKISRKGGNVFRVGDVKQSIYRFRHAEPGIFNEKIDRYKADSSLGKVLPLTENFRSSPQILAFVNHIFEQAMTRDGSEIDYGPDQRLNHPENGGCEDQGEAGLPKVIVIDSDGAGSFDGMNMGKDLSGDADEDDGFDQSDYGDAYGNPSGAGDPGDNEEQPLNGEIKALCLGVEKEIRNYMSQFDPADPEYESHYGDICVLTSIKSESETISDFLNSHGLPSAGRFTTSIFGDLDIRGIINCIVCLGNSLRDEYLCGMLLAPYRNTNFTVNDIATVQAFIVKNEPALRKEYLLRKIKRYCECCDNELSGRLGSFVEWFENLRMKAMTCDIDEIIELIYKRTDIKATVAHKEGNFNKLIIFKDWMSANFKRFGCDISGVAGELENMKIQIDTASIESGKNENNKITCMNFHKSKGLEYPFVIFALKDCKGKGSGSGAGFDPLFGFIFEDYNAENVTRNRSLDQLIYRFDSVLAENAEVLRDLYVTLTRAKTRLSIVTWDCANKRNKALEKAAAVTAQAGGETFRRIDWLSGGRSMCSDMFMCLLRTDSDEALKLRRLCETDPAVNIGFKACTQKNNQEPGCVPGNRGYIVEIVDEEAARQLDLESRANLKETVASEDQKETSDDLFDSEGNIIFDQYKYEAETRIPFKVSVTGIRHGNLEETRHVDLEVPSASDFENYGKSKLTAASKGTVLHKLMRFMDTSRLREEPDSFDDEVETLITDRLFAEYSAENIRECALEFRKGILAFASSDVCKAADKADAEGKTDREKHLVFAVPADEEAGTDVALVQGIIDLVYEGGSGWVIVDYKTDRFSENEAPGKDERAALAKEKHAFQLNSYAAAFEAAGRKVTGRYLYLVRYGEFVEV
ncbi:MAG: UvrD-helicase domain-containing protein [Saccharofermentans sp.]|nr:UvrD-helicase domain-containing protein [Saccharofermentans sp.]